MTMTSQEIVGLLVDAANQTDAAVSRCTDGMILWEDAHPGYEEIAWVEMWLALKREESRVVEATKLNVVMKIRDDFPLLAAALWGDVRNPRSCWILIGAYRSFINYTLYGGTLPYSFAMLDSYAINAGWCDEYWDITREALRRTAKVWGHTEEPPERMTYEQAHGEPYYNNDED